MTNKILDLNSLQITTILKENNFLTNIREKPEKNIQNFYDWYESQTSQVSALELIKPMQTISKHVSSMSKTIKTQVSTPDLVDSVQTKQKPFSIHESIPGFINLPEPKKFLDNKLIDSLDLSNSADLSNQESIEN